MNWELTLALGTAAGALVIAFLYARAARTASQVDQYRVIADNLLVTLKASQTVTEQKEEYIRELEKAVVGNLPASKLVERLNRLFAAQRSERANPLPPRKPGSGTTKY